MKEILSEIGMIVRALNSISNREIIMDYTK